MHINNKVVVVTGAGSGIGRELTLLLLAKGARVAAVDINQYALYGTATRAGFPVELALFTANVANAEQVAALPQQVLEHFGSVDVLINNAGIIQPMQKIAELSDEMIERVLAVNLRGTIGMTRAFLPLLLARPQAHLVNISSMGGFLPVPRQTIYGVAKAGIKIFSEGLSSELRGTAVGVTVIFPGAVDTNIMANSGMKMPEIPEHLKKFAPPQLSPQQAAEKIVAAMERNAYHVYLGQDSQIMNILVRIAPRVAANLVAKQLNFLLDGTLDELLQQEKKRGEASSD